MDIPYELKRCQACTDLAERLLADRLHNLRVQSDKMRKRLEFEKALSQIDSKKSGSSYKDTLLRLRQALSIYVKLDDEASSTRMHK